MPTSSSPEAGSKTHLRTYLTTRPETSSFRRMPVTEADQYRLQRLLSAVGSPFRKMPNKSMEALAKSFELIEFQPGDIIMQKGAMGRHLYVVDDGRVELFNVKYGQKPVLVTTIRAQPNRADLVTGKFNSRMFGQTSLRLAVPQPLGARVPIESGPCRVWRMSADAYDITLQASQSFVVAVDKLFGLGGYFRSVPLSDLGTFFFGAGINALSICTNSMCLMSL